MLTSAECLQRAAGLRETASACRDDKMRADFLSIADYWKRISVTATYQECVERSATINASD